MSLISFKTLNPQIHGRLNNFARSILSQITDGVSAESIVDELDYILQSTHLEVCYEKEELRAKLLNMDSVSRVIMRKQHISLTLDPIIMKPAVAAHEYQALEELKESGCEPNTSIAIPGLVLHIKWTMDRQGRPNFRCGLTAKKDVGVYHEGYDGSNLMHPHWIMPSDPCLGDFGPPITEARAAMDIPLQVVLLLMYLRQYDVTDCAGRKFYRWAPAKEYKTFAEDWAYIDMHTAYAIQHTDWASRFEFNTPHLERIPCSSAINDFNYITTLYSDEVRQEACDELATYLTSDEIANLRRTTVRNKPPQFQDLINVTCAISDSYRCSNGAEIKFLEWAIMFLEKHAGPMISPGAELESTIIADVGIDVEPWAISYLVRHQMAARDRVKVNQLECIRSRAQYDSPQSATPHSMAYDINVTRTDCNDKLVFQDGAWANTQNGHPRSEQLGLEIKIYLLERWNFHADHCEALGRRSVGMECEVFTIHEQHVKEAYALAITDLKKKYHYLARPYVHAGHRGFTQWLIETYDITWNGEYITNRNMAAYNALPLARQADAAEHKTDSAGILSAPFSWQQVAPEQEHPPTGRTEPSEEIIMASLIGEAF